MTIRIDNTKILADFPAATYARPVISETSIVRAVDVKAGDVFAVAFNSRNHGTLHHHYTLGSAASYALQYNECPIESFKDSVDRGHATHWANQNSVTISDAKTEKRTIAVSEMYDTIYFEGRHFVLEATPNDNIALRQVGVSE